MKTKLLFTLLFTLFFTSNGFAKPSFEQAQLSAMGFLQVSTVTLDQQTMQSYFFITGLEYKDADTNKEHPCIRGVAVSKANNKIIKPTIDSQLEIYFDYSDTTIEGNTVINCAD